MHDLPSLGPEISAALGHLQGLDDAVAYRSSRLAGPCPDCPPGDRCLDHAVDEKFIAEYQERYAAAFREFMSGFDPAVVADFTTRAAIGPPTELAYALALTVRLRELAATSGPVIVTLAGTPMVIEMDGENVVVHALTPDSSAPGHSD